jgi:AcrR family transcriptional regulator
MATGTRRTEQGGKTSLDHATIVAAGLRLAARPGTIAISVRELGADLQSDPTAIYRHFRNKEALMQALLEDVFAMSLAQITAPREDWRGRLTQLATSTLQLFTTYPAIAVEATVLTTNGPAELDIVELMLDAFSRAGLSGDELVRHYALLSSHVLSTAAGIARARSTQAARSREFGLWFDIGSPVDPATHPHVAAAVAQLRVLTDRDLFLSGVEAILQSAERTAHAGDRRESSPAS